MIVFFKLLYFFFFFKVDALSHWIIVYLFVTGELPLMRASSPFKMMSKYIDGRKPDIQNAKEGRLREIIQRCRTEDLAERPSFNEIIPSLLSKEMYDAFRIAEEEVELYMLDEERKSTQSTYEKSKNNVRVKVESDSKVESEQKQMKKLKLLHQ